MLLSFPIHHLIVRWILCTALGGETQQFEVTQIIEQFGDSFVKTHQPNTWITRTLNALQICRTNALGDIYNGVIIVKGLE